MEHLKAPDDVKALSRTCKALRSLTTSPELKAAWLWKWHGNQALFRSSVSVPVLRQLVMVHHADVNAVRSYSGQALLHYACRDNRTALVAFLISAPGIDVNLVCRWETPLHMACRAGSVRAVRQLLALPQIEVNVMTGTWPESSSLALACSAGHVEIVELLLKHPDINVNLAALLWAVRQGSLAIVAMLLRHPGIDVNAVSTQEPFEGMSPLSLAYCEHGAYMVERILAHPESNYSRYQRQLGSAALGSSAGQLRHRGHAPFAPRH